MLPTDLPTAGDRVLEELPTERPNPFGEPRPVRCYGCRLVLAECTCIPSTLTGAPS